MGRGDGRIDIDSNFDLRRSTCNSHHPYFEKLSREYKNTLKDFLPGPEREQIIYLYEALLNSDKFYHVAPTSERSRILSHGLIASSPDKNQRWEKGALAHQPNGVYLIPVESSALNSVQGILRKTKNDVWEIEAKYINDLTPDFEFSLSSATVIPAGITSHGIKSPKLVSAYEDNISIDGWNTLAKNENKPLDYKERKQLKEEIKEGLKALSFL